MASNCDEKKMLRILMANIYIEISFNLKYLNLFRFLFKLHGYRQNQQVFRDKTGGIRKTLKNLAELVYCEAPHLLNIEGTSKIEEENKKDIIKVDDSQRAWWYKSREFADHNKIHLLEDFDKTLSQINDIFRELGPFDGVWGFSMGGELATFLSKISISNKNNEEFRYTNIKFNFVIITASSKSSETLLEFNYDLNKKFEIDSLHVIGKTDKLVPYQNAVLLSDYFVNPQIYLHDSGHFIPNNNESKIIYIEFLKKMILKYTNL